MVVVRKIKIVLSLFMLAVLLSPSVIKLDHHHDLYIIPGPGNQLTVTHERCAVCSYEFSLFLSDDMAKDAGRVEVIGKDYPLYETRHYISISEYNFLLRAPPFFLS
jgi:hypothetical protein